MTKGEHIAQAVRDYLATNGLKQSKLTGALLAEIADRTLAHLDRLAAKKKRFADEEGWIKELEGEPYLKGVDVRKQLAACQFWCKNQTPPEQCTRRRFVNWLNRAAKDVVVHGGGPSISSTHSFDVEIEPKNWKTSTRARDALHVSQGTWDNIVAQGWFGLDRGVRTSILKAI